MFAARHESPQVQDRDLNTELGEIKRIEAHRTKVGPRREKSPCGWKNREWYIRKRSKRLGKKNKQALPVVSLGLGKENTFVILRLFGARELNVSLSCIVVRVVLKFLLFSR